MERLGAVLAQTSLFHGNLLLLIGLAIFGGTIGARIFKRLRIPQVLAYIIIGIVLGEHALGIIGRPSHGELRELSFLALGIIGFMIGGELRWEVFRKYGRQIMTTLIAQGLGAFVLVGVLCFGVTYWATGNSSLAGVLGLLLGAIASATAPAATVAVLWEYKTRGALTAAILAIVALDDGLSLLLYGFASSVAGTISGNSEQWLAAVVIGPLHVIGGALVLGVASGVVLNFIVRFSPKQAVILPVSIGLVLLVVGLAELLGVDVILSAMVLGVTVANLAPRRSRETLELMKGFALPIYVLFCVSVGAYLSVQHLASWTWALAGAYVIGRSAGKIMGSWLGATWSRATANVRKYLGMCLFSQGGVAVGLAIMATHRFSEPLGGIVPGQIIAIVIIATTFVVELLGPPMVKLGVTKAGEIGLGVNEEDLIKSHTVGDVMDRNPPVLQENSPVGHILQTFSEHDSVFYPVVNADGLLVGVITIDEVKQAFATRAFHDWILAHDLMGPTLDKTTANTPLQEPLERIRQFKLGYLPVVAGPNNDKLVGLLEQRSVNLALAKEIMRRRVKADNSHKA